MRSSTQVLDFIGDVGGFQGAIIMIFFIFGEFFSEKLYTASFSNEAFVKKRAKEDMPINFREIELSKFGEEKSTTGQDKREDLKLLMEKMGK